MVFVGCPKVFFHHLARDQKSFVNWRTYEDVGNAERLFALWEKNETRDHLFFACLYSYMVWVRVTGRLLGSRITPDWQDTLDRMHSGRVSRLDKVLERMAFQMTVYHIWRERNARRHGRAWILMEQLAHQIDKTLRNRISSLGYRYGSKLEGLMRRWFEVTT